MLDERAIAAWQEGGTSLMKRPGVVAAELGVAPSGDRRLRLPLHKEQRDEGVLQPAAAKT